MHGGLVLDTMRGGLVATVLQSEQGTTGATAQLLLLLSLGRCFVAHGALIEVPAALQCAGGCGTLPRGWSTRTSCLA